MLIDRFWSVSKNKTALQQLFTKWVLNKVKSEQFNKPLFLGGSQKKNDAMCVSFVNGLVSVERWNAHMKRLTIEFFSMQTAQ